MPTNLTCLKQFGGLKGRSITHALIDILHQWYAAFDAGESVRVVFIDYAKIFDNADHSTVLSDIVSMVQVSDKHH